MPTEIKNLKKTAKRIIKAVKNKERIIIYSDADLDGAASALILKEAIQNLGGSIETLYFPDREKEGYGINKIALGFLKSKAPALLMLLDCGITNFEEVKIAKELGFEVIIIDHHEVLDKVPEASIVVDPKQKGDNYPFKYFSTTGLAYRLAQELLEGKLSQKVKESFLELVALATLADMMPEIDDNKTLIQEGLKALEETFRPGLKIFWETGSIKKGSSPREAVQTLISIFNAGQTKNHLNDTYLLLSSNSLEQAENLVKDLLEKSCQRQIRAREIKEEIEERVFRKLEQEPIIFEGDESWLVAMGGNVASKICQIYKKPVFLYSQKEKYSQGAVRTPYGVDSVLAMKSCSEHLENYGGHPQASGFRVKNENLEKFKTCLIKYFKKL
ncbi:DHH family phosphoesterase [Patescibacteria group bacterium]|nr:DHH family phosphoesterase [Patescibacteria group bacterium]